MKDLNNPKAVKIGQVYRCNRRGHFVKISDVSKDVNGTPIQAHFINKAGAVRTIAVSRLQDVGRFKMVKNVNTSSLKTFDNVTSLAEFVRSR